MRLRFSVLASRFLSWARKCRSFTTVNVYRHYFAKFLEANGDKPAHRITKSLLSSWATTWHASQAIVRLFRWAVDDARLLKVNPLIHVMHPPKGQRKRTLTSVDQVRLLRAAAQDLRRLLMGYRETWARPGELRAATWDDLYPKTTRTELRQALQAGNAFIVLWNYKNRKGRRLPNEPRVILLSPRVGRLIARLLKPFTDGSEKIFLTSAGRPWTANALRCRMRRLRRVLAWSPDARGENVVPYTLRHTGATEASAAGIRDRLLADILGHVETSTTQRYQHLQTADLRAALQVFWLRRKRR